MHKHLMPNGLAVMLRAYKAALTQRPDQTRAAFGPSHRYAQVAEQIEQRILDGEWKPGQRIPPVHAFTKTYGASERTVARAIHALALKGVLTLERGAYYVALTEPEIRAAAGARCKGGSCAGREQRKNSLTTSGKCTRVLADARSVRVFA
jgi:hypothetical protein